MTEHPFHIAELITAYLQNALTSQQRRELDKWLQLDANKKFLAEFTDIDNFGDSLAQFAAVNTETTWNKTISRLDDLKNIKQPERTVVSKFKLYNYKWIAGAAAVAAICLGIYFFNPFASHISQKSSLSRNLVINDVAPGIQGATLTLANGKKIELTGNKSGVVATASSITYQDGTLIDSSIHEILNPADMLLASTANGRTYIFTLPDGTRVWLNAASSIKFPSVFTGRQRKVEISGEAYLEVFKDKGHPFVVVSRDQELEVLGTHFNLRSYLSEQGTITTLLEGSVRLAPSSLSNSNASTGDTTKPLGIVLKPNEQSVLKKGRIKVQPANTEMETAWIKNDFYFRGETLENVLRDVARWYDVKINYTNDEIKSIPLIGQISRNRPLSAVLERIASAGRTRFKIQGKQVTVMPDTD
jgi:transmembrane sensor